MQHAALALAMTANAREWTKFAILASLLALCFGVGLLLRGTLPVPVYVRQCDCASRQLGSPLQGGEPRQKGGGPFRNAPLHREGKIRLLSYQPPGNGWNNQRIALENALVLAKLLNRTLVVHPLAPHALGGRLKAGHNPGYVAYNMINESDLLPLTEFMDLDLMSQLVPVISVNTSHPQFLKDYSWLTWRNVCHSTGFGYWLDRPPQTAEEVNLLSRQKFSPSNIWRHKCPEEQKRTEADDSPIVKYVSELATDSNQMLYFEQGTLFGVHIRFTTYEGAMEAQRWVVNHVRYSRGVWRRVETVARRMGGRYNALQVRRGDHMDRKLPQSHWIDRMQERKFSKDIPVYVATDSSDLTWFEPFTSAGYRMYFASNFTDVLNFTRYPQTLRSDLLGVHEQSLCESAGEFIPSPASTFDALILRHRGEVKMREGLMVDTLHTYWIGHQVKRTQPETQQHLAP